MALEIGPPTSQRLTDELRDWAQIGLVSFLDEALGETVFRHLSGAEEPCRGFGGLAGWTRKGDTLVGLVGTHRSWMVTSADRGEENSNLPQILRMFQG